ncbi:glycoside hydrolase domain-containing protein [Microbacterium indicum]|uniref:glycoside hydrolase domain-containing protein n=1 Tax=Microbacterium indicum TaxID=358100 RepID=UPI0004250196|nr:glycoside hydrolase domain-containing protein [Microbacterium indicum]
MGDPWVEATQLWYNTTYADRTGLDFPRVLVDGQTGWQTVYALTRALQFELGLTTLADSFGPATLAALTNYGTISSTFPNTSTAPSNIVKIIQGAFYCKGYNAGNGDLTGQWSPTMELAVSTLRQDLGLPGNPAVVPPKLVKFLLTMDAARLLSGGDTVIRAGQQMMNARYLNRRNFYLISTDGYFLRDTHRALMFAIQYEIGMDDDVANGNLGPGTKAGLQEQANLVVGSTDNAKRFVQIFNFALRVNGYPATFSSTYTSATAGYTRAFRTFVALPTTGTANLQTWASLLVSTGDPDRAGTGADCVMTINAERLATLRNAGYTHFGRYLTNTPDQELDKCIKQGELERIFGAGGRVFPLFQTGGSSIEHFTYKRGEEVGEEAGIAAWAYRIPSNSTIYFSVDFDALPYQVTESVIPYFQGVQQRLGRTGRNYRIGIYGPRDVCRAVVAAGLAESSFVSDMSTGYAGNLGQPLPESWAFDQIQTLWLGSDGGRIQIDKNVVSGRDGGIGSITAELRSTPDPQIPSSQFAAFEEEWFRECYEHEDSLGQQLLMPRNRDNVKNRIQEHDEYITQVATTLKVPKALIMTPLIWEGMVIRFDDDAADAAVIAYYASMERTGSAPPGARDDSSTGPAQMFARTAIRANNWGVEKGLVTSRTYDPDNWRDIWEMWQTVHTSEEAAIQLAALNMMAEAFKGAGVEPTDLRTMNPSQVMAMCVGYNGSWYDGPGTSALIYGRRRMALYYTIHRWHQMF